MKVKSKHKVYRTSTVKKIAEEDYGFTNVIITYDKNEGWWIESDQIDNWICMDSGGIIFGLNRLLDQYHRSYYHKVKLNYKN